MSQPNTNAKNASFDDNMIPSQLIKDAATSETVAITNGSGSPSTTPSEDFSISPLRSLRRSKRVIARRDHSEEIPDK